MRVMGIDPGIGIVGCAVMKEEKGRVTLSHAQAITTIANSPIASRLMTIYDEIGKLIAAFHPEVGALESLFFNTNITTAFTVGQARGVVQLALAQAHIPVIEYSPMQVKMAITGYGRADKNQIQMMVKQILKLPEILKPDDVADAAAVALTHCFSYKLEAMKTQKV